MSFFNGFADELMKLAQTQPGFFEDIKQKALKATKQPTGTAPPTLGKSGLVGGATQASKNIAKANKGLGATERVFGQ